MKNIITKILLSTFFVFVFYCTLPNPQNATYEKTVSINAMLIAGKTIDSLWVTRTWSLDDIYDSTQVIVDTEASVIIVYEGDDISTSKELDTLKAHVFTGNYLHDCFYGTKIIKPKTRYGIYAELVLVSGDTFVLTASTFVPDQIKLKTVKVPIIITKEFNDVVNGGNPTSFLNFMGMLNKNNIPMDSVFTVTDGGDTSLNMLYLYSKKVNASDGDTILRLYGTENIMLATSYVSEYPVDYARALLLGHRWDDSIWILDTTTFLGFDTIHYPHNDREVLMGGGAVPIDSVMASVISVNGQIEIAGKNVFSLFAIDTSYYKYLSFKQTAIPWSNVNGGNGYFSSASVDSISLFVIADGFTITLTDSIKTRLDEITDSLKAGSGRGGKGEIRIGR